MDLINQIIPTSHYLYMFEKKVIPSTEEKQLPNSLAVFPHQLRPKHENKERTPNTRAWERKG